VTVFVDAIDECEYARYAPGEALGKMSTVYEKAMNGITDIDNFLKGKKQGRRSYSSGASRGAMLLLFLLMSSITFAANASASKKTADEAYSKGNYQLAAKEYDELVKKTPSAENYYNLGNALYRGENLTQAIIAYNKASLLAPADKDIAHNFQVARSKTIDKMQPNADTFIVAWWRDIVNMFNTNTWAVISIVSLLLVVLLTLTYLFSERVWLRQIGFFAGILMLIVFAISNTCAYSQYSRLTADDGAVIISADCPVKKSPEAKAQDETVVHEGTHLRITDDTIDGWLEVTLDDGTEGWIVATNVERIVLK